MSQSINKILLPFQVGAVNTALHKKKMLINLPAGSGKSLVALETAVKAGVKSLLIICPTFLRLNWENEIEKWFPDQWPLVVVVQSKEHAEFLKVAAGPLVAIVGYSYFQKKNAYKVFQKLSWGMIICDESHYLRKWESRRCKDVVKGVCMRRERLLFLSATPLVTSAADLHPTYSIMRPGVFGTYGNFKKKYCNEVEDKYSETGYRYTGIKKETKKELRQLARDFVFTARKKEILKQLPEKRIIDVSIDIDEDFEEYDESIKDLLDRHIDEADADDEIKTERERIGRAKIPAVLDLLETFPEDEQVVVFAYHRSVVKEITRQLIERGHKARMLLGGMDETKRMARVKAFARRKFRFFIISISAGGLGLNLQSASIAVYGELPYSYSEFEQCSDRVHRIGSKKRVRIYKIIVARSLDVHINDLILYKQDAAEGAGVAT